MNSHIMQSNNKLLCFDNSSKTFTFCIVVLLAVLMIGLCSCSASSKGDLSQITPPSNVNLQTPKYTLLSNGQIISNDNDSDEAAASAIREAAISLGVPFNGHIKASIGEKTYAAENGNELINISFYKDGELCAGAKCSLDGVPVANIVYY